MSALRYSSKVSEREKEQRESIRFFGLPDENLTFLRLPEDEHGLPANSYTEADVTEKTKAIYQHVYRVYPTIPSPFYAEKVA